MPPATSWDAYTVGNDQAFLYDGSMHLLGTLEPGKQRRFRTSTRPATWSGGTPPPAGQHAFLYRGGAMIDLTPAGSALCVSGSTTPGRSSGAGRHE